MKYSALHQAIAIYAQMTSEEVFYGGNATAPHEMIENLIRNPGEKPFALLCVIPCSSWYSYRVYKNQKAQYTSKLNSLQERRKKKNSFFEINAIIKHVYGLNTVIWLRIAIKINVGGTVWLICTAL